MRAADISIGANGTVMIAGSRGDTAVWMGGRRNEWRPYPSPKGGLASIAVDKNGTPWGTNAKKEVWAWR